MAIGLNAGAIDTSLVVSNYISVPQFTNIVNGRVQVQLLSIVNNSNTACAFTILDAPGYPTNFYGTSTSTHFTNLVTNASGAIGYSNGPYSAIVTYTTNIKVFYTNAMGLTNFQVLGGTYTNNPVYQSNVLWTTTNTVGPITNTYRVLFSGTIGALATLTITNQFNCIYGLSVLVPATIANQVYNVTYSSGL